MNNHSAVTTWNHVLEEIRRTIAPKIYSTWFVPIKAVDLDGNILTLEVPNEFFLSHLESNYLNQLKEAIRKILGPRAKLEYRLAVDDYKKPGKNKSQKSDSSSNAYEDLRI
mgnify:CR=1 FL=1